MKILWTDGSAVPNPGRGGFAVILQHADGSGEPVVLGSEEGCEIHSDSEFWINVLTKWADSWKARGWRKSRGEIQNLDIVKELYELYHKYPVKLVWVRGHVGTALNEMADEWANKAREGARISSE